MPVAVIVMAVCAAGTPKTNKDNYSMKQDTTLTLTAKSGVRRNDGQAPTTIELWSNPSHGTVTLASDGSFVYMPAAGFTGTDHDKDKDWSHKGKKYKGSAKNDNDDDDRDGG